MHTLANIREYLVINATSLKAPYAIFIKRNASRVCVDLSFALNDNVSDAVEAQQDGEHGASWAASADYNIIGVGARFISLGHFYVNENVVDLFSLYLGAQVRYGVAASSNSCRVSPVLRKLTSRNASRMRSINGKQRDWE